MPRIASIVYKPKDLVADEADHYLRIPIESTNLIAGYGIENDRKGGNPKRQLNIMSLEALQALAAEGFETRPGQMGEQIIIQGIDTGSLVEGDQLQFGESACIEVISHRTGCERFEHIQGKSPKLAAGRMGVMAKVVTSGPINVGATVTLLQATHQTAK